MSEQASSPNIQDEDDKASLFDLALLVLKNGRLLLVLTMLFGVLGLFIAITADAEYTTSTTVICESETDQSVSGMGNLSLLRGLGLNLGGGSMGLTAETYPDILLSREVRLAVVRDSFFFPELGKKTSYVEFATRPTLMGAIKRNTIRVPGRIIAALSNTTAATAPAGAAASPFPTRQEEIAMRSLIGLVDPSMDLDTGLLTIEITSNAANLSTDLAESFLHHLARRLEDLRTQKARQNLQFIEARFKDAEEALAAAEDALARFNDRNVNPQSARLNTDKMRLERQLSFKTELYSDLQTQLTQEKIEFERNRPVMTVLEYPAPPIDPSGPSRLLIIITSLMFGVMLAITIALTRALVEKIQSKEEAYKIEEFKAAFRAIRELPWILRRKEKKDAPGVEEND